MPAIQTSDFSLLVGTTPISVFPANLFLGSLFFMRLWNVSQTATIWCSRTGVAAVNGAGSFPLGAGMNETWTAPNAIPTNQLSVVATAAATPLTVEIG